MTHDAQIESQTDTLEVQPDQFRVLVVDNDKAHAMTMAESLERIGFVCTVATSGPEGADKILAEPFEIVVTDLVMNDIDGMGILQLTKEHRPNCEVIVVTGHATVSTAVEAMQNEALNFLEKPLTPDKLRAAALKAAQTIQLKRQNSELMRRLDEKFGFEGLIYSSNKMRQVVQRLQRIAPTDASVLILGETGTGKEVVAQAIHQNSPRKKKPFVPLNCAELSEHLLESELFGHAKGAYTDAASERIGRLEYANGGTLFLDEIGDMPMATQVKLLRVLESGEITRVGENKPIRINVRLLSATNADLETAIAAGTFRSDLYHRLRIVTVQLPPLRDRPDDILPLFDHFLKTFSKKHDKKVRGIDRTVFQRCLDYDWPGNVRQLRNFAESMVVLDLDGTIGLDDLPPELIQEGDDLVPPVDPKPAVSANGEMPDMVGQPISEVEKWLIGETLKATSGNREEAAKMLGIGERTLYRKIKEYGLRGD
ncbi:sigma-54 dependent transcriptional regulator [Bremerella sp. JC770]|uniref:sigma-54-dependent transcriptional regulator n=1 Tax=Bremerella sp. JC770 TaxID=3232137 RepID=UPI0034574202